MEDTALEEDALRERGLERAIEASFRSSGRLAAKSPRSSRPPSSLRPSDSPAAPRAHQARTLGLVRVHHAAGQDKVHRLRLADRAGQALCTPMSGMSRA